MPSPLRAAFVAALLVILAIVAAHLTTTPASDAGVSRVRTRPLEARETPRILGAPSWSLEGLNDAVRHQQAVEALWLAEQARIQAAERAAAEAAAARARAREHSSPAPQITGSCQAMKPPGFPDSIIWRESRGDPNAVNPRSGTRGCAQIDPRHWSGWGNGSPGTCAGLDYAGCWAKLYREQGLRPWAL